jgi:DNA-binding FrmR family transcriptional regulator
MRQVVGIKKVYAVYLSRDQMILLRYSFFFCFGRDLFIMKLQIVSNDPLSDLGRTVRLVGLESFSSMNVAGMFKGLVSEVYETFKFTSGLTAVEKMEPLPKDQSKFLKILSDVPYTSLGEVKAYAPEGLKCTYLEFLEVLLDASEYVMNIQKELVTPYALFLGRFISDKKFSADVFDDKKYLEGLENKREEFYKRFGACYEKESYTAVTKVKKVVERNADWPKVFIQLNLVIKNLEAVDRAVLKNQIKQCTDYIEIILKEFSSETDRKVSQEAAYRLSNHAYTIGRELELFSTTFYRALALKGCIENSMESVKEALG